MKDYICDIEMTKKQSTLFFKDVKMPVVAGMQFCYNKGETTSHKMKKIGYDVIRIYYDTMEKDCAIGQKRLKRIIYKK